MQRAGTKEQLVNLGAEVIATDISPRMVEATKRRVGENAKVLCLDLEEKLPFEDDTFDVIISSLVLHYIKDWSKPFSRMRQNEAVANGQKFKIQGKITLIFPDAVCENW